MIYHLVTARSIAEKGSIASQGPAQGCAAGRAGWWRRVASGRPPNAPGARRSARARHHRRPDAAAAPSLLLRLGVCIYWQACLLVARVKESVDLGCSPPSGARVSSLRCESGRARRRAGRASSVASQFGCAGLARGGRSGHIESAPCRFAAALLSFVRCCSLTIAV